MTEPLKILQVIPALRKGGAERLVIDISHQLIGLGHIVEIVTFADANDFKNICQGLTIHVIPSLVSYSVTGSNIAKTNQFDQFVRTFQPDIIHSHLLEAEFISRYNTIANTAYITHWHGCHPPTNSHTIWDFLKRDAWWHLYSVYQLKQQYKTCNNQFLCISQFIGEYVNRAFKPESSNMRVILNGSNLSRFENVRSSKKNERFTLISVGSFNPYTNQLFLLKALRHIVEQGINDICIRFLGDGVERENLERYVQENKLSGYVEFLGYVDNPGSYMKEADILVHAAIDEPFGLILLEAMSCGLPVVAFKSGGIPEIVNHGSTGFLTEVNNLESFTQSILKIKRNPKLAEEFSLNGLTEVQRFGIEKYVNDIETLYLDSITKRRN